MSERWVPVRGWETLYEVSDFGRVKSLARTVKKRGSHQATQLHAESIMKGTFSHKQMRAIFYKESRAYYFGLAKLVYEHFEGPVEKGFVVKCADGDPKNCALTNLVKINRAELLALNSEGKSR